MTAPVDVLIIGAGASGAAVAWSLAETKMHILCLEQGDWMKSSEYPGTARYWEARQFDDFHISPNRRKCDTDYPINDAGSPIKIANFNGVGGGTVLYAGHFPRRHPSDFRVRTLDGVADDWPIDYATLEPFYAENDRIMGVSGLVGDPAYPPHEPMMPPLPLGKSGAALARGLNKLCWHWWPSDSAIASVDYEGRAKFINLGHCTSGWAQGAKASTDITYWPAAIRAGIELKTRCRVREITTNEHGMASGVVNYDADGVEHFQPAEVVILACNAVGTARILLNSASARFPTGLANSSGLVGKNLMFHPYARIAGYFDETLDGYRGPGNCIWSQEFYETDCSRGFVRGYTFEFSRGQGPVMAAVDGMQIGRLPWGAEAESARGVSPRAAHRYGLDTLASSGSCHRTKAAASRRELELLLLPVGSLPTSVTCPLRSTGITPLPCYYGAVRPYPPHRYFRPHSFAACTFSLGIAG